MIRPSGWTAAALGVAAVFAPGASAEPPPPATALPVAALQPYRDPAGDQRLRVFVQRLAADPDDTRSANLVAREALQRLRLSGDLAWLERASAAVSQSLRAVPAEANLEGLRLSALVHYETH